MLKPGYYEALRENIAFLQKQLEMMNQRIPLCELVVKSEADLEPERQRISGILGGKKELVWQIFEEVKEYDTKEAIDKLAPGEQIKKLCKISTILMETLKDVEKIVIHHYTAKLDAYLREIKKAMERVFNSFNFIIPNMQYEIELIENYFRSPANAERSIIADLDELQYERQKQNISMQEFLDGCIIGGERKRGYRELRTIDGVFSKYQYYENLVTAYEGVNASVYTMCKGLESFIKEHRSEEDFIHLAPIFQEVQARTVTKKSISRRRKNIICMKDVFEIHGFFTKLVKKIGVKYSFQPEYQKTLEELKRYEAQMGDLIFYDMDEIDKEEKKLMAQAANDIEKQKISTIMSEMRNYIAKKRLPFERIEMVFDKMRKKDYHVVVMERDVEEMTIQITPHLAEKYGEDTLKRINLIIEEIDYWLYDLEKQEKFSMISPFSDKMRKGEDVDIGELMENVKAFDEEIRQRFRNNYEQVVQEMAGVIHALERIFGGLHERKRLSSRLLEKEPWQTYIPRLLNAKKGVLIALGFIKSQKSKEINLFPFIKISGTDLSFILYELAMRLFVLYEKADKRSISNMLNIQLLYREFRDIKSLWHSFSIFFKMGNALNFDVMEDRIKGIPKNRLIQLELIKLFPEKKSE